MSAWKNDNVSVQISFYYVCTSFMNENTFSISRQDTLT